MRKLILYCFLISLGITGLFCSERHHFHKCMLPSDGVFFLEPTYLGIEFESIKGNNVVFAEDMYLDEDHCSLYYKNISDRRALVDMSIYKVIDEVLVGVEFKKSVGLFSKNDRDSVLRMFVDIYGIPVRERIAHQDSLQEQDQSTEHELSIAGLRVYSSVERREWILSNCIKIWLDIAEFHYPEQYGISYGAELVL